MELRSPVPYVLTSFRQAPHWVSLFVCLSVRHSLAAGSHVECLVKDNGPVPSLLLTHPAGVTCAFHFLMQLGAASMLPRIQSQRMLEKTPNSPIPCTLLICADNISELLPGPDCEYFIFLQPLESMCWMGL